MWQYCLLSLAWWFEIKALGYEKPCKSLHDSRHQVKLSVCFMLIPCFTYPLTLKMEMTCSSKTLVDCCQKIELLLPWESQILQFFGQNAAETNCCAQQCNDSTGNIFFWKIKGEYVEAGYKTFSLLMPMHFIPEPILRMSFSCSQLAPVPIFDCHFLGSIQTSFQVHTFHRQQHQRQVWRPPRFGQTQSCPWPFEF